MAFVGEQKSAVPPSISTRRADSRLSEAKRRIMRGVILGAASGEMRSVLGAAANGLRLILQPPVVSARRHAPETFGPEGSSTSPCPALQVAATPPFS